MPAYHPQRIEPKWQVYWDEHKTFRTPDGVADKPKLYILDMFPYPSGAGLHVGHPEGYTATDILCRYKRMRGFNVLHPIGWDAFGLPAEQYAVKTNTHPRETTRANIDTFRRQIKSLGFSYDWDREIDTTDPGYYKWTQWIFLQIYDTWYDPDCEWIDAHGHKHKGRGRPVAELPIPPGTPDPEAYGDSKAALAYRAEVPVNWCPELGTVLANEEVIDGKSEVGGFPVVRLPLKQWMLRITAYADRLADDLEGVDWPRPIKDMQRHWIGRSEGAEVDFPVEGVEPIRVFTTRPDTLFGATYMVLAPEHPLVDRITTEARRAEVAAYREQASRKSDLDRTDLAKTKTGVFTGAHATNPVNGREIPVWIADYVLMGYGQRLARSWPSLVTTNATSSSPRLSACRSSVSSPSTRPTATTRSTGPSRSRASPSTRGTTTSAPSSRSARRWSSTASPPPRPRPRSRTGLNFRARIGEEVDQLASSATGCSAARALTGASRSRSSSTRTGRPRAVDESELPVTLARPGRLLALWQARAAAGQGRRVGEILRTSSAARRTRCPSGRGRVGTTSGLHRPECNDLQPWSSELERYWMPVDLYVGGAEHAVLHLLYSRFWHKVLFDRGHVSTLEPFQKLVNQGMILGETEYTAFQDPSGAWVSASDVVEGDDGYVLKGASPQTAEMVKLGEEAVVKKGDGFVLTAEPSIRVDARAHKMSKSRGNVINPDDVVSHYGADSLRLFEMFMGPLEAVKPWSMKGVEGVHRFLARAWRMIVDVDHEEVRLDPRVQDVPSTPEQAKVVARTVAGVTADLEAMRFNTAISKLMEFVNAFTADEVRPLSAMWTFALLLSPMAPHLAEELWQILGGTTTLAYEPWPTYDSKLLIDEQIEVPVQVNGKLRARITVPNEIGQEELEMAAMSDEKIVPLLQGKTIVKAIVLPGKLVNFVVR